MDKNKIKKDALFLIDGSYFLYRSYFAMPPLYSSAGRPTQATHAFCRILNKLIRDFDPQHIAVVWDTKGGSFRNEIYEEYKANRPEPPSDLFVQKEDIMRFIEAIDMPNIAQAGYEADDLIGSLVKNNTAKQTVIVGADKDMFQLLHDGDVVILDPFKDRLIDTQDFEEEKGFHPEKVPFYFALLGDASDNIPGVAGVGKKTATDLVMKFDSLDDLYNNLESVEKKRVRNLLTEQKENAYLSLKLFTIDYKGLKLKSSDTSFDKNNWANAAPLFEELELRTLLRGLRKNFGEGAQPDQEKQQSLFAAAPVWKCIIVDTDAALNAMIEKLKKDKVFAFDTETTGVMPLVDELVGISFASDKKQAYYIPFGHPDDEQHSQLNREETIEKLKPIFAAKSIKKILHAAKFDELVVSQYGVEVENIIFDTLIAAGLLKKEWEKINLKELSSRLLGEQMKTFKEVMGKQYKVFSQVPTANGAEYGAHDALQTFKLYDVLKKDLDKPANKKVKKVFDDIELPLNKVLTKMEKVGIMFDADAIKDVTRKVQQQIKKIEEKIFAAIPEEYHAVNDERLNLNSTKQIESLLFDCLGLPVIKKSKKGGRSTNQEVLHELGKQHPVPNLITSYRELNKLKSTYLDPLPECVNKKTGRIHTSYSQVMTSTGRLASSNPNLQNIPASHDYGVLIRSAFVAPRGSRLLSADYSQVELRILAHMSGDENLTQVFLDDKDIHAQTASQLFDVELDKVAHEQRQVGKRINFSIMYGLTPYGLARDLDIKPAEAKEYINKYFERYPGVAQWMDDIVEQATEQGYVESLWGRRRWIPQLRERNRMRYELGKRIAINTPIQATQADIIKIAMINIDQAFQDEGLAAKILLQIHDELIFEVPVSELESAEKIVKKQMESVVRWRVPIVVNMRSGKNWGELTK